ncbi:MAG TPA: response regulator [Candidatus Cloacimonadota bacterium]|nr:response regulator [Candidatus Cloacimonadota bacterium]HPT71217.1 response regulator [Candidatus Cloacimonadota bacterium]
MAERTILLIEDNPDDIDLTIRALKKNRIDNQVVVMTDGATAIDYLHNEGSYANADETPMPALILLDLKLPKMSGLEVLQSIRSHPRTKLLPVVILTSSREERDLLVAYSLGANSYIRKPIDFNHFMYAIEQIGSYWLVINELPPMQGESI